MAYGSAVGDSSDIMPSAVMLDVNTSPSAPRLSEATGSGQLATAYACPGSVNSTTSTSSSIEKGRRRKKGACVSNSDKNPVWSSLSAAGTNIN